MKRHAVGFFATAALLAAGILMASEPVGAPAALLPAAQRKASPEFALQDSSGKTVSLKDYRGKVVLLDFWATWCHGCKLEIPWFAELSHKYATKDLVVVGVSLDSDGWKVVDPFIRTAKVPYQVILGNDAMAAQYGIQNLPDTFLIDRQGRVAAVYKGWSIGRTWKTISASCLPSASLRGAPAGESRWLKRIAACQLRRH